MAGQGEQNPQSQFNARADNAALALRGDLQKQGRQMPDKAAVEVGPDGKPPAPPPPPGSYVSQLIEQQRQQAAQASTDAMQQQSIGDQPPAGTAEQAIDGSMAPPLPDGQAPQGMPEDGASPRAEKRIKNLVEELRQKDQATQQAMSQLQERDATLGEMQAKLSALQQQHQQMIQANLENLDPETRMQVMQDARLQEALAGMEQRIMGNILPHLHTLESRNAHSEMMSLGEKYPAFDIQVHGPLVEMFRGKNPACSIEQGYLAITESADERMTRAEASASAVPPVVPPGSGSLQSVRYAPEPQAQSNPEAELIEEAQRIRKMRESTDPKERADGLRLADEHLKRRLQ